MSEYRFEIGQEVWWASFESTETCITCPDCAGTGRIRCLLPDDTVVSIECEGCRRGYEGPQGVLRVYDRKPKAVRTYIKGVEWTGGKTEWRTDATYAATDDDLFLSETEALERANTKAAEQDAAERDRINHKEKPTKSWSWHVHYHRKAIRDAEKQIEYHTGKLNVARLAARTPALASLNPKEPTE